MTGEEHAKLRVGLIGLGDIARKGYLPVLGAHPDVEPVLITRDRQARQQLARAWRTGAGYERLGDALGAGERLDAAFVHAATPAHLPIARELIAAGIPTFVDKPLAYSADEAQQIVEAARAAEVSLMVGFNRRYAPAYAEVAGWNGLDMVVLTKNRVDQADDPRVVVFDDFVHVIDTLRFLVAPEPEAVTVSARRTESGALGRVSITLRQGNALGVGIMDRDSGATTEVLEAMAPGQACSIDDLASVVERRGSRVTIAQRPGWTSVATTRGFTAMVERFLTSVREGLVLDGGDALVTHELCERVLSECLL